MLQNDIRRASHESASYTVISTDCSHLLDTLGTPSSRAVLRETADTALTVDELHAECGVSRTTIYRRVNELVELGLLEESVRFAEGRQRQRQFRTVSNEITLRVGPDGFEAHLRPTGPGTPAEGLFLENSSQQQLRIALSGKDLHCRIEADGDDLMTNEPSE